MYSPGSQVEVYLGGKWAPAMLIRTQGGCCGQAPAYHVQVEGRNAQVGPRQIRRVRA